jgi:hypothetical protein
MLADALNINKSTCHQILLEASDKWNLNAKLVPRALTQASNYADLLQEAQNDPTFVNSITTEDESVSMIEKETLRGRKHENIKAIQTVATMELTAILKEAFTSCFQDFQKCWHQCTDRGRDSSTEDKNHLLRNLILYFL